MSRAFLQLGNLERNAVALTQLDAFCHTRDVREEIMAAEIGDDEAVQLRSAAQHVRRFLQQSPVASRAQSNAIVYLDVYPAHNMGRDQDM